MLHELASWLSRSGFDIVNFPLLLYTGTRAARYDRDEQKACLQAPFFGEEVE